MAPRRAAIDAGVETTEPIYTAEEKRQLILAHAAMRTPHDPVQLRSAWAGVAIAVIVIAAGWWWASGSIVVSSVNKIGPEMAQTLNGAPKVLDPAGQIGKDFNFSDAIKQASDKLQVLEVQATTRQQTLDRMAALVNATTTSSTRQNLFQPMPAATTTTSSTTTLTN